MAKLILLIKAERFLPLKKLFEPSDVRDVGQFVFRAGKESNWEVLNVNQRDGRGLLLPIPLAVLVLAIIEVLELLFDHKLLIVEDCLSA
jgi:hypothetical protein